MTGGAGTAGADDGAAPAPVERFRRSMEIGFEQWHDGVGYDLDALADADDAARAAIESMLLPRADRDWRDVEALAALDTDAARRALVTALDSPDAEIRLAVVRHAPHLVPSERQVALLVDCIAHVSIGSGLVQTLRLVAELHPPAVVDALLRGARDRDGEAAVHLAAMVLFVHGLADDEFDMSQRDFFLRFHSSGDERVAAFAELCRRIGRDPADLPAT